MLLKRPGSQPSTTGPLCPATPSRDDQSLSQRMRVPRGARARLKCNARARHTRRSRGHVQHVDAYGAGEVFDNAKASRLSKFDRAM
jgi:hypothetical protein